MKIKVHFEYVEYKNSKLATFLSKIKSGFWGFVAWMGLFLLPLIIACGIASQSGNALVALIVVGIVAIASYVFLFFIDERKIAKQKEEKNVPTAETSKYTHSKIIPDSMIELTLEDYRKKYIADALDVSQKIMYALHLHEEFLNTTDEIVSTINNDLLIYESLFGKRLYLDTPPKFKEILEKIPDKAVGIAIYTCLLKQSFEGVRSGIIIGHIPDVLLSEFDSPTTKIFDMTKEELKEFLAHEISEKLAKEED
ncbi:MAG: hypothetical protein E7663_02155 [Ruminococcaceae bacterium]|nr:hypothetical protein [Oscillospiraceae bacterium]